MSSVETVDTYVVKPPPRSMFSASKKKTKPVKRSKKK